jgi:hypothetical protein
LQPLAFVMLEKILTWISTFFFIQIPF